VDDDAETCRFMSELLRAPGREIVTAERPQEALALLESTAFDLVVSDIKPRPRPRRPAPAPRLQEARRNDRGDPGVGVRDPGDGAPAVRAGAFDYVSKPIDIAQ
jgi:CheY-like chemotaxis protein